MGAGDPPIAAATAARIERGEVEPDAALAAKMNALYGHDVADVVAD